jgi:predicted dithiol-disulfide oxidoreductase (DUF899 family)
MTEQERQRFLAEPHIGFSSVASDGDQLFLPYFTNGHASEANGSVWSFLDLTPLGRRETREDSPEGYPQDPPYLWWRLHDEYNDRTEEG